MSQNEIHLVMYQYCADVLNKIVIDCGNDERWKNSEVDELLASIKDLADQMSAQCDVLSLSQEMKSFTI